jgi:hypothetical protein
MFFPSYKPPFIGDLFPLKKSINCHKLQQAQWLSSASDVHPSAWLINGCEMSHETAMGGYGLSQTGKLLFFSSALCSSRRTTRPQQLSVSQMEKQYEKEKWDEQDL